MTPNVRLSRFVLAFALGTGLAAVAPVVRANDPTTSSIPRTVPPDSGEGELLVRSADGTSWGAVPLKQTDVSIDVRGLVASATVSQRFTNDAKEPIEAVYVFPLPHAAAVHDFELRVGSRVIRSVVKEREEARATYEKARTEGRRTALVEEERRNVFTTSVANVMPGDSVDVVVRYVEPLRLEDGRLRLTFPTTFTPRYIPAGGVVPDADRLPTGSVPGGPASHDLTLGVSLDIGAPLESVSSPTHRIQVVEERDGTTRVTLESGATRPNRDFVLEAVRRRGTEPRPALFISRPTAGDEAHVMVVLHPPAPETTGVRPPIEMLFLIDISGSMHGESIAQARHALLQGLDRLRATDRFGIVAFDDRYDVFREGSIPAGHDELQAGRHFVKGLESRGGTVMLPALEHLLAWPETPGYVRMVVVLTDGALGNEEQIFESLQKNLGAARLFTVAIGSAPNHLLATKMASYGRGSFTHVATGAEVSERMRELLDRIESPVLTDVSLEASGFTLEDVTPKRIPDLFLGEPLVVFGRIPAGSGGDLRVAGRSATGRFQREIRVSPADATFHPGVTTLWARAKVDDQIEAWRKAPEGALRDDARSAALATALRWGLVTRFTSRVAVEEIIANSGEPPARVEVANAEPAGGEAAVGEGPATGTADLFLEALGAALLGLGLAFGLAGRHLAGARA